MNDDTKLLLRYARENSQEAFAELVRRHVDLVYSAALRRCNGDTHRAEDSVQQVFVSLARNAEKLTSHPALEAWLYAATRNAVINLALAEQRRAQREQEAAMSGMLSPDEPALDWDELRPVLDAVMDELSEADRTAVLMRFFKKHSFSEIGASLNVSENTARMRTERALEKLRLLLGKRGVRSSAAALGLVLGRQAVVAAPAAVAAGVTACVLGLTKGSPAIGVSATAGAGKGALTALLLAVAVVLVVVGVVRLRGPDMGAPVNNSVSGSGASMSATLDMAKEPKPTKAVTPSSSSAPVRAGKGEAAGANLAAQSAGPSDPKAVEILKKMAAAYTALTSYQDWGEEVEKTLDGVEKGRIAFQTSYRQPGQFTQSWSKRISSRTIWSGRIWWFGEEGGSYSSVSLIRSKKERPGLVMLTGGASTQGSSFHVPRFFTSNDGRILFSLADLCAAALSGEVMFEDGSCHVIKGQHPNGTPYELWINQKDFLLRKIQTVAPLAYFKIHAPRRDPTRLLEETHRGILINQPIADGIFQEARLLSSQAEK